MRLSQIYILNPLQKLLRSVCVYVTKSKCIMSKDDISVIRSSQYRSPVGHRGGLIDDELNRGTDPNPNAKFVKNILMRSSLSKNPTLALSRIKIQR